MKKQKILLKILLILSSGITCFILGGIIGGYLHRSEGLIGAALAFWYAAGGFLIGVIAGIILSRYLTEERLRRHALIVGLMALLGIGFMLYRYYNLDNGKSSGTELPGKQLEKPPRPVQ